MKRLRSLAKKLLSFWPILILLLFSLFLSFLNYQPHTWLTGWDNLHSEFNFPLHFKRYFSVWQQYRGLGLLAGMAHSADLLRTLFAYLLSFILPLSFLRYFFTFLTLTLGPLGVYFFASQTLLKNFSPQAKKTGSLFAGLFYLLNLATVQIFYIPFETFIFFFAFFPWLLFTCLNYLDQPNRKNFLLLTLILLLATPSFYVQTLFLVFILSLTPFLIHFLVSNLSFSSLKKLLFLVLTILFTQAYWLLPNAYFTLTSSDSTTQALQNRISTREMIARNREYGQISDLALLKGFNFDYTDLNLSQSKFQQMMDPWIQHLNQPVIQITGYLLFALILIGLFYSLIKKLPFSIPLIILTLISLFFLINLNPPFSSLYRLFQQHLPLLDQAFRSPFTKWITPLSLTFSLFFSVATVFLLDLFSLLHFKLTYLLTAFSLTLALILFSSPAFQGHLIYSPLQQDIPSAYLQLFDYLKTQDHNTRLANFPQHTLWGWRFYSWGYRGSGFLWYGIPQATLDRAFDPWSSYNQTYYQEIKTALYSQNLPYLEHLLEKYQVNWLLIDHSVIIPASDSQTALYTQQLRQMLAQSSLVTEEKVFDHLILYSLSLPTQPQNFINTQKLSPAPNLLSSSPSPTPETIIQTPQDNHSTTKNQAQNCDQFNDQYFDKQITADQITYTATDANSCDHFSFPSLPHSYGYQLIIQHRNQSGFPFSICLESHTSKNCLLYQYLDKSSHWHTSTLTLPPMNPQDSGYTLHLYNYSIGQTETKNSLRQIKISPLPASQFNLATQPSPRPYTTITSTQKHSPTLYVASTNSSSPRSLITLNQSFHKGWQAYLVPSQTTSLSSWKLYSLSTMLQPLPTHQKVNNWANGWLLPPGKFHLLIVYQPQLLQLLGFSLLLLFFPFYFLHQK